MQAQSKYEPDFSTLRKHLDQDLTDKKNSWEKVQDDPKLSIYRKSMDNNLSLTRTRAIFENVDIDILCKMLVDGETRKTWDDKLVNGYVVERLSANEEIVYAELKAPSPVSNRDTVNYRCCVCNKNDPELVKKYNLYEKENKYYMSYSVSVVRPDVGEKKGLVRQETILMGWVMEVDPSNPKNVIFSIIMHNDPKGSRPGVRMKAAASKLPVGFVESVRKNYPEVEKKTEKVRGNL